PIWDPTVGCVTARISRFAASAPIPTRAPARDRAKPLRARNRHPQRANRRRSWQTPRTKNKTLKDRWNKRPASAPRAKNADGRTSPKVWFIFTRLSTTRLSRSPITRATLFPGPALERWDLRGRAKERRSPPSKRPIARQKKLWIMDYEPCRYLSGDREPGVSRRCERYSLRASISA